MKLTKSLLLAPATIILLACSPFDNVVVTASDHDGNLPENTRDNNFSTRWSAEGSGEWIKYGFETPLLIENVDIGFYDGKNRTFSFDVQVSNDNNNWTHIYSGTSELNNKLQTFNVPDTVSQYVRVVGYGNTENSWNSYTEIKFNDEALSSDFGGGGGESCDDCTSHEYLQSIFDTEGDSPYINEDLLTFDALQSKHTTPNGNGWRNELKVKKELRVGMSDTYEEFDSRITIDMSPGSKTIVAQHHASDTGTLMKVYISDTNESGFINSKAADGIFDVYVRLRRDDGSEAKQALGTLTSGESFDLLVVNDYGFVSVKAFGETASLDVKDDSAAYFKFGNYLQAQDPYTLDKVEDSGDFGDFYEEFGITKSEIRMKNTKYIRND